MPRYAAFLRAVNLGRTRKASSAVLRSTFEDLDFEDVATFQTSGNVVFSMAGRASEAALRSRVEAGLEKTLGFPIPVFLRSEKEILAIAAHEPFDADAVERSKGKLQVALLPKAPSGAARRKALAHATDSDPLAIDRRELYWLPSGGTLESELDRSASDKLVGPTTTRTMGTIERMAAKFFGG